MSVFEVEFDKHVLFNTPVRVRKPKKLAWLKALIAPVKYIYGLFMPNRLSNLYYLAHNSQVCYLEAALNDLFDVTERRIYIGIEHYDEPLFIYIDAELKPVFVDVDGGGDVQYLFNDAECAASAGYDFRVVVPVGLEYDAARMVALVNRYKLPGKRFIITN